MRTWLRRNRTALLLLPIAVITAVLASSSRIDDYWWSKGLHDRADVSSGVAHFKDEYDDGYLSYPIAADISLTSVEPVTTIESSLGNPEPVTVPEGGMLWRVSLAFQADPDVVLWGCKLAIVDSKGTRYDSEPRQFRTLGATPIHTCVPDDTPGPKPKVGSVAKPAIAEGESPRPPAYGTVAYVVTPEGVKPESVRVWWLPPKYAELTIDDATSHG